MQFNPMLLVLLIIIGSFCFVVTIVSFVYAFSEYESFGILLGCMFGFLTIVCVVLIAVMVSEASSEQHTEYDSIISKLEQNPFDQEGIKEAIIYNSKVEQAEKFDKLNVENDYEEYINEPIIDVNALQMEYIEEHFGLGNIVDGLSESDKERLWEEYMAQK